MSHALKRLPESGLEAALEKADRYRDLNQPEEAESICRDILDVRADHQGALRTLGLALTDRFPDDWSNLFDEAIAVFEKLTTEYDRVYYAGVAWERAGKAQLALRQAHNALVSLENALDHFEKAGVISPTAPDPILRWNRCVRALQSHPLLLDAARENREHSSHFGD